MKTIRPASKKLSEKTKSLNQSGAFLQIHVINELKKRYWSITAEYPVKTSPFIGEPKNHSLALTRFQQENRGLRITPEDFVRASIESQNKAEIKETSIDVIASRRIAGADFFLCIEAKKLDPRYMDWIFFKQQTHEDVMRMIKRSLKNDGDVQLFTTLPTRDCGNETYLQIKSFPEWEPSRREIVDFALALKKEQVENEYYKSEKTRVDESARQIVDGTFGLIIEKILQEVTQGEPILSAGLWEYFIPIIVTNANLFICDLRPEDINPETGHITKEPTYRSVDAIIYECAASKLVQFPDPLSSKLTAQQNSYVAKWHILIMSPKGFRDFLDSILQNT